MKAIADSEGRLPTRDRGPRVAALLSANQTTPGYAGELFFLDGEAVAVDFRDAS